VLDAGQSVDPLLQDAVKSETNNGEQMWIIVAEGCEAYHGQGWRAEPWCNLKSKSLVGYPSLSRDTIALLLFDHLANGVLR
jgi:hypothetical protein